MPGSRPLITSYPGPGQLSSLGPLQLVRRVEVEHDLVVGDGREVPHLPNRSHRSSCSAHGRSRRSGHRPLPPSPRETPHVLRPSPRPPPARRSGPAGPRGRAPGPARLDGGGDGGDDLRGRAERSRRKSLLRPARRAQSGTFPCLRLGSSSRFEASSSKARISTRRVSRPGRSRRRRIPARPRCRGWRSARCTRRRARPGARPGRVSPPARAGRRSRRHPGDP